MPDAEEQFPELEEWIADGVVRGDTHMLVVYDQIDHNHFPAYVGADQSGDEVVATYDDEDDRILVAVFDLRGDLAKQLADYRTRHYGG